MGRFLGKNSKDDFEETMRKSTLSFEEINTLLVEVESVVNV